MSGKGKGLIRIQCHALALVAKGKVSDYYHCGLNDDAKVLKVLDTIGEEYLLDDLYP